ncbi:MAG: hypothetical protein ACOVS5_05945 [Oligoflexus sp.]
MGKVMSNRRLFRQMALAGLMSATLGLAACDKGDASKSQAQTPPSATPTGNAESPPKPVTASPAPAGQTVKAETKPVSPGSAGGAPNDVDVMMAEADQRLKMKKQLEQLDRLEFQDLLIKAVRCGASQDTECVRTNLRAADGFTEDAFDRSLLEEMAQWADAHGKALAGWEETKKARAAALAAANEADRRAASASASAQATADEARRLQWTSKYKSETDGGYSLYIECGSGRTEYVIFSYNMVQYGDPYKSSKSNNFATMDEAARDSCR